MGDAGELRIGLTISGAIALGAYEGGALAALLVALQRINEEQAGVVRLDAITGASAGSITGVLAARALLEGYDPVRVMYRSWVEQPELAEMIGKGKHDPLSVDGIAATAAELLDPPDAGPPRGAQATPIRMDMALGCLRGLDYAIAGLARSKPVQAQTHLDWGEFTFFHGDPKERFLKPEGHDEPGGLLGASPVEVALASGAHALAFPPRKLMRARQRRRYLANGITNFPDTDHLWYTDGGTLNNQPLGRTLDIANEIDGGNDGLDGDGRRLLLLIDPDPEAPPSSQSDLWADPADDPEWTQALTRTLALVRSQHLYDDLRQVEKTNSRLEWTGELQTALLRLLADDLQATAALREVLAKIATDKEALTGRARDVPAAAELGLPELLARVLHEATGLSKKQPVQVDVVSPRLLLADGQPPEGVKDLLAGEFLGHFGGFLDVRLRHSDFLLGYRSTERWLGDPQRGLASHGVAPQLAAAALTAVAERRVPLEADLDPDLGRTRFKDLPRRARWAFYRLVGRIARISLREIRSKR